MFANLEKSASPTPLPLILPAHPPVHVRRGREAVLRSADLLTRFAEACAQPGAMSDLSYFLAKPGVLKRTPLLLLIGKHADVDEADLTEGDLLGVLLLYEYRFSGLKTGLYTTNDRSGRNTLLAPAALRSSIALLAAKFLLGSKAQVMLLSFRDEPGAVTGGRPALPRTSPPAVWAMRQREIPEYLPLAATYDHTLATIGQRTRSNLRYYRRRTARELGCRFQPALEIEDKELLLFNRSCMYAVPDPVAIWRLSMMKGLQNSVLMGLYDRDGCLLSVIGGRRVGRSSEILWQMNRAGLPHLSLSLVMRGYFLEHEIGKGADRFYVEGGTPHPIRESFTKGTVTDLAVLRRSPTASLIRRLARYAIEDGNELASMLFDPALEWQMTRAGGPKKERSDPAAAHAPSTVLTDGAHDAEQG